MVEMLTRRIEVLGAVKTGNFCVDCETYQSAPTMSKKSIKFNIWKLHFTNN